MKLRSILAGTALAALTITAAPQLGGPAFTAPAEAAVDVNIGIFYDQLGQYGDWVTYDNEYVFIPGRVDAGWRPYTEGHWVYTRRYGWTWASDEPFGWATYHYGRWGYSDEIGWYWVPGRKWAPAWVSWRRSNDYVVWAPLPPSRRGGDIDVSINISVGDIPDYYWVAVPTRRFLAPDIAVVVVNDDRDIREVVERTEYVGTPRITNNIVVNNVIDVDVIAQETGQKVEPVEVKTTANPAEAKATAGEVTAFQGEIAADTEAKPKKLTDVNTIRKAKRNKTAGDGDTAAPDTSATGAATSPVDDNNDGTATSDQPTTTEAPASTGKDKKKVGNTAPADVPTEQSAAPETGDSPATQAQDQPAGKKKRQQKQDKNANAPAGGEQPASEAQDQPAGKKKKRLQNQNASSPDAGEQPQASKKKKQQQQGDEATGSTTAAPPDPEAGNAPDEAGAPATQKRKGKGKKDQTCEPGDPDCPAQ